MMPEKRERGEKEGGGGGGVDETLIHSEELATTEL